MAGRYKPYSEYKQTGSSWVSEIPNHWNSILFKRIVLIIKDGTHGTFSRVSDGVPFLSAKNVQRDGINITDSESMISEGDFIEITKNGFPSRGDLLITCVGTIGRTCVYDFDFPYAFQRSVAFLRLSKFAAPKYYKYFVESKAYQSQLEAYSKASAQSGVYMGDLVNTITVYPPLNEQKVIANFLDHETAKIDTLIEKQQELIQLLKEKRQAVISHAVTKGLSSLNGGPNAKLRDSGVEWLGDVPEHWGIGKVKNLASIISKGTTPSTMGSDFESTGIRFLKAENIGKGFYVASQPEFYISERTDEQLSRSRLQSHDVLVIIAGATTGQSSVMLDDLLPANTNQAVSFIRPASSSYSSYISYWLSTEYAQSKIWQMAVQAAQPNLSMESLGNIYIPIPPEHELDELIANINFRILQLSRLTESAELAINLMQERRTALISAAVTGKIDVRDWVAPQASPTHKEVAA